MPREPRPVPAHVPHVAHVSHPVAPHAPREPRPVPPHVLISAALGEFAELLTEEHHAD
ncbi:hypothetical protein AB0Q95_36030 [Streptomyces sp. NPDC059900]|uniref:hypothetical protein n=1 Tax=Streptomyces sp. NPDC059900 TaxID=3155816 RepID=UPI00344951C2